VGEESINANGNNLALSGGNPAPVPAPLPQRSQNQNDSILEIVWRQRSAVGVTVAVCVVLAILYLSVFGSVIAFSSYYYLIKKMDATIVSLSTLIIPIVALILGRAFLGEMVTPLAVAGIVTILAGVAIAILPSQSSSKLDSFRDTRAG